MTSWTRDADSTVVVDGGGSIWRRIPVVVRWCFCIDLGLALAYLFDSLFGGVSSKLTHLLHLGRETNLPTWYSSTQLFVVAAMLGLFAYRNFDRNRRRSRVLAVLPLVLLALSIDETAEIHEWLGQRSDALLPGGHRRNTPFWYSGVWMFLLGIPFLAFLLVLIRSLRGYFRGVPGVAGKYLLGAVLFVGGAAGVEILVNFVPARSMARVVAGVLRGDIGNARGNCLDVGDDDLLRAHGFKIELRPMEDPAQLAAEVFGEHDRPARGQGSTRPPERSNAAARAGSCAGGQERGRGGRAENGLDSGTQFR